MDIATKLNLPPEEQKELARILECKEVDLPKILTSYSSAALEEIVTMFLGQKVFTRGSDLLEYRLLLLIKHSFGGHLPNEKDVCRLFQVTSSGSRALIRAVMSKYQYLLKPQIEQSLTSLISSASYDKTDDVITISIHNLNLVEELNRELAEIDTSLPPVKKKPGSVATYEILPSAYQRLCDLHKVTPKQKPKK